MNKIEIEMRKEKACCKDLITAINLHLTQGDVQAAKKCAERLDKSLEYIVKLDQKSKAERQKALYEAIRNLNSKGHVVHMGAWQGKRVGEKK